MKITKQKQNYFELITLRKRCNRQNQRMEEMVYLIQRVSPATVFHVKDVKKNVHPSVWAFAKSHDYDYQKLLRLLQQEGVLEKVNGTWILAPAYRHAGLVFYTIGRNNRYGTLDMYLLPGGEEFMLAFMNNHPTKRIKRKE